MNVTELERIARESHNGQIRVENERDYSHGLQDHERMSGVSIRGRRDEIRRYYPNTPILAAELGCFVSTVVREMNQIEGIEAFGIDLEPILDGSQNLSPDRLIVADLNDMPHIPDESFHYMFSWNCLSYTEPTKSFPEIYRILAPGGIADLDLEFWHDRHVKELLGMELHRQGCLMVATSDGKYTGSIQDYAKHIQELAKTNQREAMFQQMSTRFVLTKPYEPRPPQ